MDKLNILGENLDFCSVPIILHETSRRRKRNPQTPQSVETELPGTVSCKRWYRTAVIHLRGPFSGF